MCSFVVCCELRLLCFWLLLVVVWCVVVCLLKVFVVCVWLVVCELLLCVVVSCYLLLLMFPCVGFAVCWLLLCGLLFVLVRCACWLFVVGCLLRFVYSLFVVCCCTSSDVLYVFCFLFFFVSFVCEWLLLGCVLFVVCPFAVCCKLCVFFL